MVVFGGVAGITICRRTLIDIIYVAGSTSDIGMRASQWEGSISMIEGYVLPAAGVMTGCAICAELTTMCVLGGMTGIAIFRSAFEYIVYVTSIALNVRMTTR